MMDKKTKALSRSIDDVLIQFLRIINKYNRFDKVPMDFGIEDKLFPIEIHTIDAIGKNPEINVTKLAQITGVTKGAVSQKIRILESKELVRKVKGVQNNKEIQLELTEKGWLAYEGHELFHSEMYLDIIQEMKDLTVDQYEMYGDMLDKIEYHFDRYIKKLL